MFKSLKSHNNPKNRLQEFCQKNQIGLPLYDLSSDGSTCVCTCTILYKKGVYKGQGRSKKVKDAEKEAAQQLLDTLNKFRMSMIQTISRDGLAKYEYIIVYIDMENINVKELAHLFNYHKYNPTQFIFKGLLSTNHHYAATEFEKIPEFQGISFSKRVVPSTRSDGADIGMVMQAMRDVCVERCGEFPPSEIVFVSRDKFSCVFVDLVNNNFCVPEECKGFHCSSVSDLKQLLGSR